MDVAQVEKVETPDCEDILQYESAKAAECEKVVTNNTKHFIFCKDIKVVLSVDYAQQFLK